MMILVMILVIDIVLCHYYYAYLSSNGARPGQMTEWRTDGPHQVRAGGAYGPREAAAR